MLERIVFFFFWGSGDCRVLDKVWLFIEMFLEYGFRKLVGFFIGVGFLLIGVFIMDLLWC